MSKAKLTNELIKRYVHFIKHPDDQKYREWFLGFLEATKIILTEEQILNAFSEGNKRVKLDVMMSEVD